MTTVPADALAMAVGGFLRMKQTAPAAATGLSAIPGNQRIEVGFTAPADPAGGTLDRVRFTVSDVSAADAISKANAGEYTMSVSAVADAVYSGISISELPDTTNLLNGTRYYIAVQPVNSDGVFRTVAASDVVFATPVKASAPTKAVNVVATDLASNGDVRVTFGRSASEPLVFFEYRVYSGASEAEALAKANSGADWDAAIEGDNSASYSVDLGGYANDVSRWWVVQAAYDGIPNADHIGADGTYDSATPTQTPAPAAPEITNVVVT